MAKRKQTTTFIFEQQLKGEYWDWSDEKKRYLKIGSQINKRFSKKFIIE